MKKNRPALNVGLSCCPEATLQSATLKVQTQMPQTPASSRAEARMGRMADLVGGGKIRDTWCGVCDGLSPNTFQYWTENRSSSKKPK
jgi:hypothetical protein